jgi:hypothetical protein
MVVRRVQLYGKWCFHAFYNIFGGKEIIEVFRTKRRQWWSLSLSSSILFTFGQLCLSILICLVFMIFLIFFLFLARCFSCILPLYLSCVFPFFDDISITYKKKTLTLLRVILLSK